MTILPPSLTPLPSQSFRTREALGKGPTCLTLRRSSPSFSLPNRRLQQDREKVVFVRNDFDRFSFFRTRRSWNACVGCKCKKPLFQFNVPNFYFILQKMHSKQKEAFQARKNPCPIPNPHSLSRCSILNRPLFPFVFSAPFIWEGGGGAKLKHGQGEGYGGEAHRLIPQNLVPLLPDAKNDPPNTAKMTLSRATRPPCSVKKQPV